MSKPSSRFGAAFWNHASAAALAIGNNDLYDRLLDCVGHLVPHDLLALVRYSVFAPPDLIIPRNRRTENEITYLAEFYAFDPFWHHWREHQEVGVFSLRGLAPAAIWRSRYAREYLRISHISDEIAIFMPPLAGASPTLIVDRAEGRFTAAELGRLRQVFPLLAGLHQRHLQALVERGIGSLVSGRSFGDRPQRLLDRHGVVLVATEAWQALLDSTSALSAALARLPDGAEGSAALDGGSRLLRSRLPADFGPAPGGFCDHVERESLRSGLGEQLPSALAGQLTAREQEIVRLTLQGHPIASIAQRLELARGTVKNYRRRIYEKLDITTERELFLEYIAALER